MTETDTTVSIHGEVSCADTEAILAETIAENDGLRDENAMLKSADAARQAEMDALRMESARTRALLAEMRKKMGNISDERSGMDSQVKFLLDELEAAERDAVPADSFTFAVIAQSEVVSTYRAASRITRGPLPPAITEAVQAAAPAIREAMEAAGQAELSKVVAREVRRRRRAQGGAARGAARRAPGRATRTRTAAA
jgi:predicted nuclease with TOPRIM domain